MHPTLAHDPAAPTPAPATFAPAATTSSPTGRRRLTPQMLAARATRPATWEPVKRGQALSALKRAAPALGIPGAVVGLLDYLVGRTDPADWTEGARPVAFPSNFTLQDALGVGRTQLKARIRAAAEHGLIEMDDGPNGKRFGQREGGRLIEAYGFDLTPLLARRAEFEAAAAAHQERRREGAQLRRRITATCNRVLALTDDATAQEMAGADWPAFAADARALAQQRGDSFDPAQLAPIAAQLGALQDRVRELVEAAARPVEAVETDPKGPENRPHITPTNHLQAVDTATEVAGPDRPQAQGEGGSRGRADPRAAPRQGQAGQGGSALRGFVVTPEFLLRIAPAFRDWVSSPRPGWGELAEAARWVGEELGVSRHAWGQACVVLGRVEAVTVLAAISARRAAGEVRSPGGLLRRMVELHQVGELRLDRTLFGLEEKANGGPRAAQSEPTSRRGGRDRAGR